MTNAASGANPSTTLYLGTPNHANRQADTWQTLGRDDDAALMARLSTVPVARWFEGKDADVEAAVRSYVSAAAKERAMPVLVAYNIPDRDAGQYSRGGVDGSEAYAQWITAVARGIGDLPAMLILEPDALPQLNELPAAQQAIRCDMLHAAVETLTVTAPRTAVYIDAGHPGWQTPATMAECLKKVGIEKTAGFSLNVSNFFTTEENTAYGTALSALVGNKHFVIDTSRNGNGTAPDGRWYNPSGRALGNVPALQAGRPLVDAYLWIKIPGESDAAEGPSIDGTYPPAAGIWWPEYALELARNAGW